MRLICCMIVQNEEKWLPLCLEALKNEVDHFVVVDGGSTDDTLKILSEILNMTVLSVPYEKDSKGADGKQRNVYLDYVKARFKNDWCVVVDADEVYKERNYSIKYACSEIESKGYVCANLRFHHLINSFGFEDATLDDHWTLRRLFKIQDGLSYPEVEHPILQLDGFELPTCNVEIEFWHFANARETGFYLKNKYENNLKKSNMHHPDNLRAWYLSRLLDQFPKKPVNPRYLPRVIKKHFLLDKLLTIPQGKMKTLIVIPTVPGNEILVPQIVQEICLKTPEEFEIMIAKNDYRSFAYGVNKGFKAALADDEITEVVIMNDDISLENNWLGLMRKKLYENESIGIVGDETSYRKYHVAFYCTIFKKKVIEEVGLLDERYLFGEWEDIDFCVRAADKGYTIARCDDKICTHGTSFTMSNITAEMEVERKKNRQRFKEKWGGTRWEMMAND